MVDINHSFVEQTTQQTHSGDTNWTDISGASITSGNFTVGNKYLIVANAQLGGSSTSGNFGIRTIHGSTSFVESEHNMEPTESGVPDHPTSYGWFTVWTAVASEDIKLQFQTLSGGQTVRADQITLVAIELEVFAENTDYFFDFNSTTTALNTTFSSTNNASVTVSPSEASDWLVFSYSRIDQDNNSESWESRIQGTGGVSTTQPLVKQEGEDTTNDRFNHFMARGFSLTAVSHTFTQQSRNDAGTGGDRTHNAIFAINMDKFIQHSFAFTEGVTGGSGGNTEIQTTSITPTITKDVWAGTYFIFQAGPDDEDDPQDTGARMQIDNVDQPPTQTSDDYELLRVWDLSDLANFYIQSIENLDNTAHAIDLDIFNTNSTVDYSNRLAFAIQMEKAPEEKEFTVDGITFGTECKIEVREFTLTTGTGTIDFTGFGFQPTACLFIFTQNASQNADSASADGMGRMLGMCDGTRQWAMYSGAEDAQGTSDTGRRSTTTGCILNVDNGNGSQTVLGKAEFDSFLSDGVRLNRTTAFTSPTSSLVRVIAFGGSAVQVYGDIFDPSNTINTSASTTAPNFEPDLLITGMIGNHMDVDGSAENDDDSFSMGWAVNPDRQASNNQFCIAHSSSDGQASAVTNHAVFNNRCCVSRQNDATDTGIEITSFDTNGFTATTRDASAGADDRFFYLALRMGGDSARVFSVNQDTPSATGSQSQTGTTFEPIFLLGEVIGDDRAFNTWSNGDVDNSSIGIGLTDDTRTHSLTAWNDHGADPTNTASRIRDTHFHSLDDQGGVLLSEATFTSFNSDGWTLDFTTASAVQKSVYLAIGECVFEETFDKTFTVDAIILAEQTFNFTVDGIILDSPEKVFLVDGLVQDTFTEDFTVDGLIQILDQEETFTVDALPQLTQTETFTVDAFPQATQIFDFTVDAFPQATQTETFTIDAFVQLTQTETFTVDAFPQATQTETFTVDAFLLAEQIFNFTVDVLLQGEVTKFFLIDAFLQETFTEDFDIDGFIQETFTKDFTVNAIVVNRFTETFLIDAFIQALNNDEDFLVDAFVQALNQEEDFTIDAFVLKTKTETFLVDAFVLKTQTKVFTVDAFVLKTKTEDFLIDAFVQDTFTKDFLVDAEIAIRPDENFDVDGLILDSPAKLFSVDALRQAENEKMFLVDVFVQETFDEEFIVDSLTLGTNTNDFTINALVLQENDEGFFVDAFIQVLDQEDDFEVDALILKTGDSLCGVNTIFTDDITTSTGWSTTGTQVLVDDGSFPNVIRMECLQSFQAGGTQQTVKALTRPIPNHRTGIIWEFDHDHLGECQVPKANAIIELTETSVSDEFGNQPALRYRILHSGSNTLVRAEFSDGVTDIITGTFDITTPVTIFPRVSIVNDGNDLRLEIFSDSGRTTLVSSISDVDITSLDGKELAFIQVANVGTAPASPQRQLRGEIDNFDLKADLCPKFEIDALLEESTLANLEVDAFIQKQDIDKTFLVDAILFEEVEKTFLVDAHVENVFTFDFTVDTRLAVGKLFTVDAQIVRATTFTVDAILPTTVPEDFTVDGLTFIFPSELFLIDAFIQELDQEKTFIVDAELEEIKTVVYDIDGLIIKKDNDKTFIIDGLLPVVNTETFEVDAIIRNTFDEELEINAVLLQTNTETFNVDAELDKIFTKDFIVDGITLATQTSSFTVDTFSELAKTKDFTIDAKIEQVKTKPFTVSAIIIDTFTEDFTVDGSLQGAVEFEFTADALLLALNQTFDFTVDGIAIIVPSGLITIDGLIQSLDNDKDFTVNAIIVNRFDEDFLIDGLVKAFNKEETFDIDAQVALESSRIFEVDGSIKGAQEIDFTVDARVTGGQVEVFTVDAQIFLPNIVNFTVDAQIEQPVGLLNFTVDAKIRNTFTFDFTIDGNPTGAGQKIFQVDGLTLGTQTFDFTIDGDVRNVKTTVFDVDAIIKLTGDTLCAGTGIVFSDSIPDNTGWTVTGTNPPSPPQVFVDTAGFPNVIRFECLGSRLYSNWQAVKSLGVLIESKTDLVWEFKHNHITPCAGFRALSEFSLTETNTLASDIFQGAIKYRITVLGGVNRVQARLEDSSGNVVFTTGILNLQPDTIFYPRVSIINDGNDLQLEMFTDSARTVNVLTTSVSTAGVNNETLSFIQVSPVGSGGMGRRAREEFDDITINTSRCPRFDVDARLLGEEEKTFTVDANIVTLEKFTVDTILKELGALKSFSVDAFLGIPEIDFTVDAVLSAQGKVTVDALVQALGDNGCSGGFFFDTIDDATPWTVIGGSQILVDDNAGVIEWNALRGGATVNERFAHREIPNFADNEGEIRIRVKVDKISFNIPFFPTGRFMVLQNNDLHPNPSTGSSMQLFLGNGGIFANINDGTNGVSTTPPIEFPNGTTKFLEAIYDPVGQTLTLNVYTDANFTVHDTGSPVQANASSISMTGLTFTHVITSNVKNSGPARIITASLDDFTIGKAGCPTVQVDSIVKAFDTEKTFTVDAEITRGKIFLVDSILTLTAEEQFTVDVRLSALEEFTVDAKIAFRENFTIDGSTLGTVDKDFTIDGITIIFPSGLILIDAIVQIQGTNKVFTVDSRLKAFDTEKDFTVDSQLVQDEIPVPFTIDGRIVVIQTTTFSIDGIIKLNGENGSCNFFPGTNLAVDTGLEQFIGPIQPDHEVGVEQLVGQEVTLSNQQVRSVSFLLRSSNFPNEIILPMPIDAQVWSGVVVGNLGGETTEAVSTTVINASNTSGDLPPGDWTLVKFEFDVNTTPFLTGDFVVGYRSLSSVFGPAGVGTAIPVISNSNVIDGSAVHRKGANSGLGDLDEWGFLSGDSKDMIIQLEVVNGDDIILGEGNQCPPVDAILVNTPAEPLVDAVLVDRSSVTFGVDTVLFPLPKPFEVDGILVGTQLEFTIDAQIVPQLAIFLIDGLVTGDGQKPFLIDAQIFGQNTEEDFEVDTFIQAINKNAPLFNCNALLSVERTVDFTVDGLTKFFDKVGPFTIDAQVIFFPSQLPQVDGLLKRVGAPKFFFVDAFIQITNTLFPFTEVDALIQTQDTDKTFLVDVLLVDDKTTDFNVDARLSTPGAPKLFSVDALTNLQNGRWQTDALLSKTKTKPFLVDVLIVALPQKLFLIDGITIGEVDEEFIIDGLLEVEAQKLFLVDARILQIQTIDYTVDAIIKDFGVTVDFTVDAEIVRIGEFLIDSFVQALGDGILGNGNNGGTNDSNSTNPYVQQPTDDNTITLPIGTLVGQRLRLPTAPVRIDDYTFVIHRAGTAGTPTGTLTGKIYKNSIAGNSISGADLIATSDNVVNLASITTNTNGQNVQFTFTTPPETTVDDNVFIGFDIAGSNEQMFLHTESTGTVIDGGDVNVESTGVWGADLGVDAVLTVNIDLTPRQRGSALMHAFVGRFIKEIIGVDAFIKAIGGVSPSPLGEKEFTVGANIRFKREAPPTRVDAILIGSQDFTVSAFVGDTLFTGLNVESVIVENNSDGGVESVIVENNSDSGIESVIGQDT